VVRITCLQFYVDIFLNELLPKAEQIMNEIENVVPSNEGSTFVKPKSTYKWSQTGPQYEYDYNEFTYFKVIKIYL
jgi:hypothetical protein